MFSEGSEKLLLDDSGEGFDAQDDHADAMINVMTNQQFKSPVIEENQESSKLFPIEKLEQETSNMEAYLANGDPSSAGAADSLLLTSLELTKQQTSKKKEEAVKEVDGWEQYTVIGILGEGSYGRVYKVIRKEQKRGQNEVHLKAKQKPMSIQKMSRPQQLLVIKELQTDMMPRWEAIQAMTEIDIHGQLAEHPYTVKYHDSFIAGTKVNIVMEFCPNGDLQEMLRGKRCAKRSLPETQVNKFLIQTCLSLLAMHDKGILHRDLKTQNIFLTKNNDIRIGDFGLAR